ncbi:thioredoxin domain-containing protein [Candidatus Nomurabacteria bacterium]|nr:thioredoxin domain-containing protein [Candidatus Nomurabacteria bacterium]
MEKKENATPYSGGVSGMLNNFSPAQVLGIGVIGGFMVLCTIGFFILLGIQLDNDDSDKMAKVGVNPTPSQPTAPTAPTQPTVTPRDVGSDDHIRGNKNASITIIEYSDIECPFCNRFHGTMKQVMDNYGDKVKWVYRHNPLTSLHANAYDASLATECAGKQGKFWELTDYLFDVVQSEQRLTRSNFSDYASAVGLNVSSFESCLNAKEFASKVSLDQADVPGKGTPFSIIVGPNGEMASINGAQPYSAVEAQIQQFLQ